MSEIMKASKIRYNALQNELTKQCRLHDAEKCKAISNWAIALGTYAMSLGFGLNGFMFPASVSLFGSISVFKRGFKHSDKASYIREEMAWLVHSMQLEPAANLIEGDDSSTKPTSSGDII